MVYDGLWYYMVRITIYTGSKKTTHITSTGAHPVGPVGDFGDIRVSQIPALLGMAMGFVLQLVGYMNFKIVRLD